MATGTITFLPGAAVMPDGSAGNAAPGIRTEPSSGGPPGTYDTRLRFDGTTEQWCAFKTTVPADFSAGTAPVAKVAYVMDSAIAGGIAADVRIAAMSDGDASIGAKAFGAANIATTSVPRAVGTLDIVSVTLTNRDSMAAGDVLWVYLGRATGNAGDTAAGFMDVSALSIEYTTA